MTSTYLIFVLAITLCSMLFVNSIDSQGACAEACKRIGYNSGIFLLGKDGCQCY